MSSITAEKRAIVVNGLSNALFFVCQVAVVFFVSPLLVHGLGDSRYGAWLLVNSVLAYMAMAELGVGASVVRYVSRFEGLRDQEAINRVFSTSLFIFSCVGSLLFVVTLVLAAFWELPFGVSAEVAGDMRWLLAILGTNVAVAFPLGIYKTVLTGLARYPAVNAIRISTLLLRNALFVLLIRHGGGLPAVGLAITLGALLDHACSVLGAYYYLPGLRFSFRFVDRGTFRTIWSYSIYVFLAGIGLRVSAESNPLIIGAFLTPAAVTFFGIAASLSNQAGDGLRTAIAVLMPTISKLDATGDTRAIRSILITGSRYLLFLTVPVQMGLIFLGRPFLALWMGPRYAELCYPTLVILSLPLPLALVQAMACQILGGIGKVAGVFGVTWLQAVLGIVIGMALIRPLGIEGVAWGSVIALAVQTIVLIGMACRAVRVPISTFILRCGALPAAGACFLAVVWGLTNRWLPPISSWTALFAIGSGGMIFYVPLVLCLDSSLRGVLRSWQGAWRTPQPSPPELPLAAEPE